MFALTDDEVIAIGGREGRAWPSPVPTVDVLAESELRLAADRGSRSLFVRGLLGSDGRDALAGELDELVSPVVAGDMIVATYFAREDFGYLRSGPATAGYSAGSDRCSSEIVVPSGIHYLAREVPEACLAVARMFLSSCWAPQPEQGKAQPAPTRASWGCVVRPSVSGVPRMVAVRRGKAVVVEAAGAAAPALSELASIEDAFAHLSI